MHNNHDTCWGGNAGLDAIHEHMQVCMFTQLCSGTKVQTFLTGEIIQTQDSYVQQREGATVKKEEKKKKLLKCQLLTDTG